MQVSFNKDYLIYLIWFFPVLGYLISPLSTGYPGLVWFAFLASLAYGVIDKSTIVHSIVLSGLLSPLAGSLRIFSLLPSEILLAIFAFLFIVRWLNNGGKIRLIRGELSLFILLFILISSYLLSYEYEALTNGIINYLALFFIYILTKDSIKSTSDIFRYFRTLIVVSVFVSLLIKVGFDNNLVLSSIGDGSILTNRTPDWALFRASYFYTGIFLILGAALISNFYINYRNLTLRLSVSALLIYTLFIMFSKTTLVALILTTVSMVLINSRNILRSTGALILISILILLILVNLDSKHAILTGSIEARLIIIDNAFYALFSDAQRFFFGSGPDSTILLNTDFIRDIINSQGTIDSGFVTYAVEFGLIFLLIFLWSLFTLMLKLIKLRGLTFNLSILSKVFLGILILFVLTLLTQRVGSSKVMWVIIQILALSNVFLNMRLKKSD